MLDLVDLFHEVVFDALDDLFLGDECVGDGVLFLGEFLDGLVFELEEVVHGLELVEGGLEVSDGEGDVRCGLVGIVELVDAGLEAGVELEEEAVVVRGRREEVEGDIALGLVELDELLGLLLGEESLLLAHI